MKFLVTGCAGFIGFHVSLRLLSMGYEVTGIDNLNDYYDPQLKQDRLRKLDSFKGFCFIKLDLADRAGVANLFDSGNFKRVIHLAAQAGVRYSIENPMVYADSNLIGHLNILEGCRRNQIEHLVYASSSSVYGMNKKMPFSTEDTVDHPVSLYAATKKANELMSHTYSHLYEIPTTGLRFFTVYGPWGRPDMAIFLFTKAILEGEPIKVFNFGKMKRDFTYIDDIVEGIVRIQDKPPLQNPDWTDITGVRSESRAPYKIYNIGNSEPVELERLISAIEAETGIKAVRNYMPIQPGDVEATFADVTDFEKNIDFTPSTSVEYGVSSFVQWYRDYYKV